MAPRPGRLLAALGGVLGLVAMGCTRENPAAKGARSDAAAGEKIFLRTQTVSTRLGGNALACTNCHLECGRMPGALALRGAASTDRNPGALEKRIVRCFTHSLNARAPETGSETITALAAYIRSLGVPGAPPVSDQSRIAPANLIPIGQLKAERGRARFGDLCSGCHGLDGQGYRERRTPLPYDYVPPVWGPRSYNDVAGLARVDTLAGFLRHAMPRDEPGTLDDRDAQEIAAFVDGQPRPVYLDKDSWDGSSPVDAVYDTRRYLKNPFSVPLDLGP